MGFVLTVSGVLLAPDFLRWMCSPPEVVEAGAPYLRVIFLVSAARLFFFVAAASLRGAGDTRSPMWITLWMNLINIVFNYLLIFGKFGFPELKLLGSGVSTSISLLFAAGAVGWILATGRSHFHLRLRHFRPDGQVIRRLLRLAVPGFAEEMVISVGFLIFFSYIARLGTTVLAAHSLATRLEALSFMAGFGFSVAAATLVGQSLGMKSVELAKRSFRRTTVFTVVVMSAVAVALILFGRPVLALFCPAEEVMDLANALLIISAVEQPLLGIVMTLSGGLRGAGDTVSPMISSAIGNLFLRIFVVYWLAFPLGLGIYGVVIGTMIDWIVRALVLFYFYSRGKWSLVKV
jgi:putative MATE family efflux protein